MKKTDFDHTPFPFNFIPVLSFRGVPQCLSALMVIPTECFNTPKSSGWHSGILLLKPWLCRWNWETSVRLLVRLLQYYYNSSTKLLTKIPSPVQILTTVKLIGWLLYEDPLVATDQKVNHQSDSWIKYKLQLRIQHSWLYTLCGGKQLIRLHLNINRKTSDL